MRIGIAGYGVVGGALGRWFQRNTGHAVEVFDPPKQMMSDLRMADVLFVCVPVPTVDREQDLTILDNTLRNLGTARQRIFIRSSVLPGTADHFAAKYGLKVYAMPEFLTERFADRDQDELDIVCGCNTNDRSEQYTLLSQLFASDTENTPAKSFLLMSNVEAELAKYAHNGNGTVKVHFNNLVYQLARKLGADYGKVRQGMLMSGHVAPTHTLVPGPDGLLGYGGTCFPKDMDALIGLMHKHKIHCGSLGFVQLENDRIRKGAA